MNDYGGIDVPPGTGSVLIDDQAAAVQLLQSDRDSMTVHGSWYGAIFDSIGVPGFAGQRITPDYYIDPTDRGRINADNAYILADARFRKLNAAAGNALCADDWQAIYNAYRSAAALGPTPTITATLPTWGEATFGIAAGTAANVAEGAAAVGQAAVQAAANVGNDIRAVAGRLVRSYEMGGLILVIGLAVGLALLGGGLGLGFGAVQGAKR